jgi:uncharacterized protein (TIGR03086 family)
MDDDLRPLHANQLSALSNTVHRVGPEQLDTPSPCDGWTVADLLAHSIGQHVGFEAAVRDGDAPPGAYAWIGYEREAWDRSVSGLIDAFASADLTERVHQVELRPGAGLRVGVLVAAQLLDTVVHHWDLATALGESYTPPADAGDAVWSVASRIPSEGRDGPEAAFAAPRATTGSRWEQTLAHLGRDPSALR